MVSRHGQQQSSAWNSIRRKRRSSIRRRTGSRLAAGFPTIFSPASGLLAAMALALLSCSDFSAAVSSGSFFTVPRSGGDVTQAFAVPGFVASGGGRTRRSSSLRGEGQRRAATSVPVSTVAFRAGGGGGRRSGRNVLSRGGRRLTASSSATTKLMMFGREGVEGFPVMVALTEAVEEGGGRRSQKKRKKSSFRMLNVAARASRGDGDGGNDGDNRVAKHSSPQTAFEKEGIIEGTTGSSTKNTVPLDLQKLWAMRVTELKVLYRKSIGGPGQLRKAVLIERLYQIRNLDKPNSEKDAPTPLPKEPAEVVPTVISSTAAAPTPVASVVEPPSPRSNSVDPPIIPSSDRAGDKAGKSTVKQRQKAPPSPLPINSGAAPTVIAATNLIIKMIEAASRGGDNEALTVKPTAFDEATAVVARPGVVNGWERQEGVRAIALGEQDDALLPLPSARGRSSGGSPEVGAGDGLVGGGGGPMSSILTVDTWGGENRLRAAVDAKETVRTRDGRSSDRSYNELDPGYYDSILPPIEQLDPQAREQDAFERRERAAMIGGEEQGGGSSVAWTASAMSPGTTSKPEMAEETSSSSSLQEKKIKETDCSSFSDTFTEYFKAEDVDFNPKPQSESAAASDGDSDGHGERDLGGSITDATIEPVAAQVGDYIINKKNDRDDADRYSSSESGGSEKGKTQKESKKEDQTWRQEQTPIAVDVTTAKRRKWDDAGRYSSPEGGGTEKRKTQIKKKKEDQTLRQEQTPVAVDTIKAKRRKSSKLRYVIPNHLVRRGRGGAFEGLPKKNDLVEKFLSATAQVSLKEDKLKVASGDPVFDR